MRKNTIARALAVLAAAACLLSMMGAAPDARAKKPWTVLVYMLADNDLEEDGMNDLREMMKAGSGKELWIAAQVDRIEGYDDGAVGGLANWVGAKRVEVDKGSLAVQASLGAVDSGSPAALQDFVAWGVKAFPAERYALVLWDHGGGWQGYGYDETSGNGLDLPGIASALKGGLAKGGLPTLELLGFDACLMGSYEAMAACSPFARWYLASEELEPGHGWNYASLSLLASAPKSDGAALGKKFIADYFAQATAEKTVDEVTLSLIDCAKFPAAARALDAFAADAKGGITALAPALGRGAGKAPSFGKTGKPEEDCHMVDLAAFAEIAAKDNPGIAKSALALKAAVVAAVASTRAGADAKGSYGVSIYFPDRKKYYDAGYEASGSASWKALLAAYYAAGSAKAKASETAPSSAPKAPAFDKAANPDNEGVLEADGEGGWTLSGKLEKGAAAKIVDSVAYFGVDLDDATIFVGDTMGEVDAEAGAASAYWDGTVLKLAMDGKESYAYLSESWSEEGKASYSVPFAYWKTGKVDAEKYDFCWLEIEVDGEGNIVDMALYRETPDGEFGELRPAKGSKIAPLLYESSEDFEDYYVADEVTFDPRRVEELEFNFEPLDPGTEFYMELSIYDSGEGEDWVSASGEAE